MIISNKGKCIRCIENNSNNLVNIKTDNGKKDQCQNLTPY